MMRVGSSIRVRRRNGVLQPAKIYAIFEDRLGVSWDEVVNGANTRLAKVVPFQQVEMDGLNKFLIFLWKNKNHLPLFILAITFIVDIFIDFFDQNKLNWIFFFFFYFSKRKIEIS